MQTYPDCDWRVCYLQQKWPCDIRPSVNGSPGFGLHLWTKVSNTVTIMKLLPLLLYNSQLIVFVGDHKQTPSGLSKGRAAAANRQKVNHLIQASGLRQRKSTHYRFPWLAYSIDSCLIAAILAVLMIATAPEEFGIPECTTTLEATALEGPRRYSIILPNSSRVSLLTYKAIVAVRYPELVLHDQNPIQIGHFVSHDHTVEHGGFRTVLWDAPKDLRSAVEDVVVVIVASYALELTTAEG